MSAVRQRRAPGHAAVRAAWLWRSGAVRRTRFAVAWRTVDHRLGETVRMSRMAVVLFASTLLASCASRAGVAAGSGSAQPRPATGGSSPGEAALRYANALLRDDTETANNLVARDRRSCPTRTQSSGGQVALVRPNRDERLTPRVVRTGQTWRVSFVASSGRGGSSSSSSPLFVVKDSGRYFVC